MKFFSALPLVNHKNNYTKYLQQACAHHIFVNHVAPRNKQRLALMSCIAIALGFSTQANAVVTEDMGTFIFDGAAAGSVAYRTAANATGTYTTSAGGKGTFVITQTNQVGFGGNPTFVAGETGRGIMVAHAPNQTVHNDQFNYRVVLTPNNPIDGSSPSHVNTLKIGQTTYASDSQGLNTAGGNSELARQTLNHSPDTSITGTTTSRVSSNPVVPLQRTAMGDYVMGTYQRYAGSTNSNAYYEMNRNVNTNFRQLRVDNSNNPMYYFTFDSVYFNTYATDVQGATQDNLLSASPRVNDPLIAKTIPQGTQNGGFPNRGGFPDNTAPYNLVKAQSFDPNNQNAYPELAAGKQIATATNGTASGSYVSYGVANANSEYVVSVYNPKTLDYQYKGFMNGSSAAPNSSGEATIGETVREWISFGVTSERIYNFSGIVFNDNGGITTPNAEDLSSTYTGNKDYFNGKYNASEQGIGQSTLTLTDCNGKTIDNKQTQVVATGADIGRYSFKVIPSAVAGLSAVCIVQQEPTGFAYTVDTTANTIRVPLQSNVYDYKNNDFGEVVAANTALVLIKRQYINDCDLTRLGSVSLAPSPDAGYSKEALKDVDAGQCIAYRIDAVNRGNIPLTDVVIKDTLQKAGVEGAAITSNLTTPEPASAGNDNITFADNSVTLGNNGTVVTRPFLLEDATGDERKIIFFNTKYGTIQK